MESTCCGLGGGNGNEAETVYVQIVPIIALKVLVERTVYILTHLLVVQKRKVNRFFLNFLFCKICTAIEK